VPDLQQRLTEILADRYRVERELGGGGMARVFLAEDLRHRRRVAIKVMRPELAHAARTERFRREVGTVAALAHPRILPLIDSGAHDDLLYFVMPYVAGGSLRERMAREGPLPIADAIAVARAVADGLAHAHTAGVIHRDVKPENVLLLDGEPVLADFGLARPVQGGAGDSLTVSGVTMGTPGYMSPEQLGGGDAVDARTDVYNLGLLLYEMLAGQPAYTAPSREMLIHQHLAAPPPDVRLLRPQVPAAVAGAIVRALAKTPADRYRSAREFSLALAASGDAAAAQAAALESARTVEGAPLARPRRLPSTRAILLAVFALLLAGATFLAVRRWWPGHGTPGAPDVVAILPFAVRGEPALGYLGDGMVTLMSASLGDAGGLRAADAHRVLSVARRTRAGTLGPESAAKLARELGADLFVLGDVVSIGREVRLQAALYDAKDWRKAPTQSSAQGLPDSIASLVDRAVAGLLVGREQFGVEHVAGVAATTTRSLPALKAFLEGVRLLIANQQMESGPAFRTATELDSTFAMAWYWYSDFAAFGESDLRVALRRQIAAVRTGLRWSSRLPQRERQALLAKEALFLGDADRADSLYRSLTQIYPDDVVAWQGLFFVSGFYDLLRGRDAIETSGEIALRITQLEPDALGMLGPVIWARALEGRLAEADSISRYFLRVRPRDPARPAALAFRAAVLSDAASEDSLRLLWRTKPILSADYLALLVACDCGALQPAYRFLLRNPVPTGTSSNGPAGPPYTLALFEAAGGRAWEAGRSLATTRAADPVNTPPLLWLLTVMDLPVPREQLLRASGELSAWRPDPKAAWGQAWEDPGLLPSVRCYLLGLLEIRLGRQAEAKRWEKELERQRPDPESDASWKNMVAGLQAELAIEGHEDARALLVLEAAPTCGPEMGVESPFWYHVHERYLRARLLQLAHRDDESRRWYETIGQGTGEELALVAPCQYHLGEICEAAGETDQAIAHYHSFVELWKDCDPELRPRVEEARRRMERLQAHRS